MLNEKPNRAALAAALLLMAAIAAAMVFFLIVRERQALLDLHAFRVLYALAAAPTMAVIVINLVDIRRAHHKALEDSLAAARRDAETTAQLLDMEKNYSRARDIASARRRKMSTLSHDIMQPVASMRAELDALKSDVSEKNMARLDRILAHFTALTADLSQSGEDDADGAADPQPVSAAEPVPAALVIESIARMFAAEARDRRVALRTVPSSQTFFAPATSLMRVAANLVANALNHAEANRILIGVRRKGDELMLFVADDGIGFDATDAVFAAGVKGDASSGDGLGLSIVKELSDAHDWRLSVISQPGRGSTFAIAIPNAASQ